MVKTEYFPKAVRIFVYSEFTLNKVFISSTTSAFLCLMRLYTTLLKPVLHKTNILQSLIFTNTFGVLL